MRTLILPYKAASNSARELAQAMGLKRIRLEGSRVDPSTTQLINWGNSRFETEGFYGVMNPPLAVANAANKLTFFRTVSADSDINIPEFTADKAEAQQWLNDGVEVVVRHRLTGHSGDGIELVSPAEGAELPEAPLYTKYMKKRDEYRIHVIRGVVTDVQRKARNTEVSDDGVNWKIRNHGNGFVFVRKDVEANDQIKEQAIKTVEAAGLDFGAVDIIWNQRQQKATVLEVNTACGLEGTTLERYTKNFQRVLMGLTPLEYEVVRDEPVEQTQQPDSLSPAGPCPYETCDFPWEVVSQLVDEEGDSQGWSVELGEEVFVSRHVETRDFYHFTDDMTQLSGRIITVQDTFDNNQAAHSEGFNWHSRWLIPVRILRQKLGQMMDEVDRGIFYMDRDGTTEFTSSDFREGDYVYQSVTEGYQVGRYKVEAVGEGVLIVRGGSGRRGSLPINRAIPESAMIEAYFLLKEFGEQPQMTEHQEPEVAANPF